MIDTITIFFSTLMCLLVVFRAIRLDGQRPWFGAGPGVKPSWDAQAGAGRDPGGLHDYAGQGQDDYAP